MSAPTPAPAVEALDDLDGMRAEIERLRAANAELAAQAAAAQPATGLRFKVSDKQAVSVYGLGRLPVTMYAGQWQRLLDERERLLRFIEDNRERLSFR